MDTIKHILLATDGSEHALHAAGYAGMLSGTTGAAITIVSVHNEDAVILNALGPAIWTTTVPYSSMSAEEIRKAVEDSTALELLPAT